jgi:tetrahydromethanopterin S-methyltransferase subunit G
MSKLQDHIKDNDEQYAHFHKRIDEFADFLQSAMNPTVTLKNGDDKEMFMGEAVVVIHNDLKAVKKTLNDLDKRTEILEDLAQIKNNWTELKKRVMKILRPIFRFIVYCSIGFIMIYLIYMVASGKLTTKDAFEYFMKLIS